MKCHFFCFVKIKKTNKHDRQKFILVNSLEKTNIHADGKLKNTIDIFVMFMFMTVWCLFKMLWYMLIIISDIFDIILIPVTNLVEINLKTVENTINRRTAQST